MSNTDRTQRYLQDLHAAEIDVDRALWNHVRDRSMPEDFRELCEDAISKGRKRCMAIEQRLIDLGTDSKSQNAHLSRVSRLWNTDSEETEQLALGVLRIHAAGCYLNAAYHELCLLAKSIGDFCCVNLASQGETESGELTDRLIPVIEHLSVAATA